MPIWKIEGNSPVKVSQTKLNQEKLLEQHLEDWVVADPGILGEPLLVMGRQVIIPEVKDRLDLLALDPQGNAVIVELKRGKLKDPVEKKVSGTVVLWFLPWTAFGGGRGINNGS